MKRKKKAIALTLIALSLFVLFVISLWGGVNKDYVIIYIFTAPFAFALALIAIAEWRGKDFTKSFGSADVPSLKQDKRENH